MTTTVTCLLSPLFRGVVCQEIHWQHKSFGGYNPTTETVGNLTGFSYTTACSNKVIIWVMIKKGCLLTSLLCSSPMLENTRSRVSPRFYPDTENEWGKDSESSRSVLHSYPCTVSLISLPVSYPSTVSRLFHTCFPHTHDSALVVIHHRLCCLYISGILSYLFRLSFVVPYCALRY